LSQSVGVDFDLDDWLPEPQVRTRQRCSARTSAERLWHAAETVRVRDAPALGRVVRWRIPGTSPDVAFRDLFRHYPFIVLDEGERWSMSGLCGRIWTLQRDYPRLGGAEDFVGWSEPGTVRVALAHWVEAGADSKPALVSEARVKPVDRAAALRLRALWTLVGRFERLIGGEALRAAARRAER
jgi:hypothetical protein